MTRAPEPPDEIIAFADLDVRQQPDDVTCGPTCLQGVYGYLGTTLPLDSVIDSVRSLAHGGTLGVMLGIDALERGYAATLYTYNLDVFDPSWFDRPEVDLADELRAQRAVKGSRRLAAATETYLEFLERGGEIRHSELTPALLTEIVRDGFPPITGLSSTYLYGCEREVFDGRTSRFDHRLGTPVGHFVVISGVDPGSGDFRISDPSTDNPLHGSGTYWVSPHRLIGAILLGVTTYDGNILVVRPREG